MATNLERRKIIFHRYAENLQLYRKAMGEIMSEEINEKITEITYPIYICPLCLRIFRIKAVEGENPLLTLEHVPPDGLGGSAKILTCKKCNNIAGTKMDKAIIDGLLSLPFLNGKPGSSIPTKFMIDSKRFQGELVHKKEKELIIRINENYNRNNIESLFEYFERLEGQVKFTISVPSKKRFNLSVLRVAYLQAFAIFGYSFVYNENTEKIRRFINFESPEVEPIVNILPLRFTEDMVGIHLLRIPKEISNYLVVIPFKSNSKLYYLGVIIPGADEVRWQSYVDYHETMANLITKTQADKLKEIPITFAQLEGYNGIIDDKMRVGDFYTLWTTHREC